MPTYAGINGVVRKLKEWPVGIDGIVRQQKEVWAGVDGVKRKIFSAADPVVVTLVSYDPAPGVLNGHFILKVANKEYDFSGSLNQIEITAKVGDALFVAIPAGTSGKIVVDFDTAHPLLKYSEDLQKNRTVEVSYNSFLFEYLVNVY